MVKQILKMVKMNCGTILKINKKIALMKFHGMIRKKREVKIAMIKKKRSKLKKLYQNVSLQNISLLYLRLVLA